MKIKKHIPNTITCANLFAGCIGIVFASEEKYEMAAYMAILAAIFDFFDGTAARLLHVKSSIGKELDSLADVVSFGVLPAVVFYYYIKSSTHLLHPYLAYLAFFIAVFSAVRLARFNVDTRQHEDFIGLNVPTNALMLISFIFVEKRFPGTVNNFWILGTLIIISCYLLNSTLPFFSLKINRKGFKNNQYKFIFVFISLVLIAILNFASVPIIVLFYIILSQIHFKYIK